MRWTQLTLPVAAIVITGLSHAALAQGAKQPITLDSTGAYEVGGKMISNPKNPAETLSCDHGYVEYFIPAKRRSVGLILWHSSSTKVWENRWDGGEGFKSIFLRRGYQVIREQTVLRQGIPLLNYLMEKTNENRCNHRNKTKF